VNGARRSSRSGTARHPRIATNRKQKHYPALDLTVLHAQERDAPPQRQPLEWKLITNLPVRSKPTPVEKIDWYAMRWKIETFHKILKSGCRAEDSRPRTAVG